ncbi:oxidoreductase [Spongisporangium articulatum]|uniref:Oxidoreductase n=1 Tax=Spongisporangium articulatum TaxID=3362603 RepID=A0ABW8ATW3_9ACTN
MVGSVYVAAGGDDGVRRLAEAWHRRVLADEVVSHAFSHGFHPEHTERLAAYWAEAWGGPATFSTRYRGDDTLVLRMHAGQGRHEEMDDRAVACFDQALADVEVTDERLAATLHDYFAWVVAEMAGYPESPDQVPDGLAVARWSWDGPLESV